MGRRRKGPAWRAVKGPPWQPWRQVPKRAVLWFLLRGPLCLLPLCLQRVRERGSHPPWCGSHLELLPLGSSVPPCWHLRGALNCWCFCTRSAESRCTCLWAAPPSVQALITGSGETSSSELGAGDPLLPHLRSLLTPRSFVSLGDRDFAIKGLWDCV